MGYPAKSYELFRLLGETLNENGNQHSRELTKLLSNYSLQTFFVYDPVKNPEFAKRLEQDFMFFDRLTGRRMMFMCLLKGDYLHEGARYRYYDFFDQDSWVGQKAASTVVDLSLATQLLCNELNIDYEHSPYLIITTDFRNDWAYVAELTLENIEETMHILASMAMQIPIACIEEELRIFLINNASSIHEQLLYRKYQKPLAQKLMHFLQRTDKEQNFRPDRQRIFQMDFINKVNSASTFFKNRFFGKPDFVSKHWEEKYFQQLAGELALNMKKQTEDFSPFTSMQIASEPQISLYRKHVPDSIYIETTHIETEGMEPESKNLLKICSLLASDFLPNAPEINDFSFFTVNLAKCFEIELNHSIGQLIRKKDGIEMPEYFYKLKPDGNEHPYLPDNLHLTNPKTIALNKPKERRHWFPLAMGETRLVWNSMKLRFPDFHKNLVPPIEDYKFDANWQKIQEIRNKTSHTQPVSKEEKDAMLEAMNNLSATQGMASIQKIKKNLKSKEGNSL